MIDLNFRDICKKKMQKKLCKIFFMFIHISIMWINMRIMIIYRLFIILIIKYNIKLKYYINYDWYLKYIMNELISHLISIHSKNWNMKIYKIIFERSKLQWLYVVDNDVIIIDTKWYKANIIIL